MSALDSLKDIVRAVAPTLGTALGGPVGGTAARFLSEKLLGKPDGTHEELAKVLATATPEQLATLKQAEQEFALEMRKLDIRVDELEVEDRKDARELAKLDIRPQIGFSLLFFSGYFYVLAELFTLIKAGAQAPNDEFFKGVLVTVVGIMTAAVPQILSFWFGSSLGSKQAGHDMKQMTSK